MAAVVVGSVCVFFFKQKTAYEMRMSDWSSDVCSSDLAQLIERHFAFLAGSDDFHSRRRGKFEQGAKRARCRAACLQLQQLAKQDQRRDDRRRFEIDANAARMIAESGREQMRCQCGHDAERIENGIEECWERLSHNMERCGVAVAVKEKKKIKN